MCYVTTAGFDIWKHQCMKLQKNNNIYVYSSESEVTNAAMPKNKSQDITASIQNPQERAKVYVHAH